MKKMIAIITLITLGIICFLYLRNREDTSVITLYGNIEIRQVNLAFRIAGRIIDMKYEEGDEIKQGDVLSVLDKTPVRDRLNSAKADLSKSRATLSNAENVYAMNRELCKEQTVSRVNCDKISTNKEESQSAVEGAKARVAEAQTALNDTELLSPSDGVILTRVQEKGAIVAAGTPVYTLSLTKPIWVRAYLSEKYLGNVKIGDKVEVYTDSNPKKPFIGRLAFISPVAEFTPKTVETTSLRTDLVYRVKVIVDENDRVLKQGMPVTVKINLENKK